MEAYERLFPMVPTRGSITCRAILDRQTIHVRDMATAPGVSAAVRNLGHKSQISLPLLRDGAAIGAVVLSVGEIGGFTDSQVALLQTFAEQAVIAITSAETYRELQQRTGDLRNRSNTRPRPATCSRSSAARGRLNLCSTRWPKRRHGSAAEGAIILRLGRSTSYVSASFAIRRRILGDPAPA